MTVTHGTPPTTEKFRPRHYALAEIETMRSAEVGFAIHYVPCTGVNWAVGVALSPDGVFWTDGVRNPVSGESDTLEEALVELVNAARAQGRAAGARHVYFANCDISLHRDQRSFDQVAYDLQDAAPGRPFSVTFDPDAIKRDYYEPAWVAAFDDDPSSGHGGYTAVEALQFLLGSIDGVSR